MDKILKENFFKDLFFYVKCFIYICIMELQTITESKIEELKEAGIKVDCYSWKREGKASGKATENCDYAIDILIEDKSDINFGQTSIEINPYNNNSNLVRLKFNA